MALQQIHPKEKKRKPSKLEIAAGIFGLGSDIASFGTGIGKLSQFLKGKPKV